MIKKEKAKLYALLLKNRANKYAETTIREESYKIENEEYFAVINEELSKPSFDLAITLIENRVKNYGNIDRKSFEYNQLQEAKKILDILKNIEKAYNYEQERV